MPQFQEIHKGVVDGTGAWGKIYKREPPRLLGRNNDGGYGG
jgi:hypothetical protein